MTRKKLPIGIQTFSQMISGGYCYADKTALINQMVSSGSYYFLSRPRRFGKSLLISTLKSLFLGQRELFAGLAIEPHWDWTVRYPVLHISFGGGIVESREELDSRLRDILKSYEREFALPATSEGIPGRFADLMVGLHRKFGQRVVLLIDEYDKPILDNIVAGRDDEAVAVRDGLKSFYSVIKDSGEYVRFALLTGVSKFSKVSLFSGLNNLQDITLDTRYATICGYTQQELELTFADWLDGVDMAELRRWYNGYNFNGEKVYNPFDVLFYLDTRQFDSWWFESGSPSFLIRLLHEGGYPVPRLDKLHADSALLSAFDVGRMPVETLMFQTGYLTIHGKQRVGGTDVYRLGWPNQEVRQSFNGSLLALLTNATVDQSENYLKLYACLEANDLDGLRAIFHAFFASIPHDWYRRNQLANYEGYYASIFYCYFAALGLDVRAEETTSFGRIDLTLRFAGRIYIMEFKVIELDATPGSALAQIKRKGYADKFAGQACYLIGVEFESATRNIVTFEWEHAGHAQ